MSYSVIGSFQTILVETDSTCFVIAKRFVVVCPSSLVANWAKEFDKWLGKACQPKRAVIKKGGEEAINQIKALSTVRANQPQVIIISYDLFRMNASLFQQIKKVGLLVVDEGHRLKNTAGSLTLTALESLPCEARLCITATPIQNILSDFFNIANFVCPGLLGDLPTFRKGKQRFGGRWGMQKPIVVVSSFYLFL